MYPSGMAMHEIQRFLLEQQRTPPILRTLRLAYLNFLEPRTSQSPLRIGSDSRHSDNSDPL